jgi:MFS family permease
VGLLGTLLGVRAGMEAFGALFTGLIMAGYYAGYIIGTWLAPRIIRNVGHIRSFAAYASVGSATSLAFGLVVDPWVWLVLRIANGLCVLGLYMVVESWLNEQSAGPARGSIFSAYMASTLVALGLGQFLLLLGDTAGQTLFSVAAILICIGVVPVAITRVSEPRIDAITHLPISELLRASPLGVIGALSSGVLTGAFLGMGPIFGQRLALEDPEIALFMSAAILGGALLQWPIGHLSDLIDRRTVLILTSLATAVVAAVAAVIVIEGRSGLVPSAFFLGGLMFSLYGISVAHTNDHLEGGQVLEATRGLLLIYGIGAFAGPLLAGFAMQGAGPVGLLGISAATAAGLALFGLFRVTRRMPPPPEEQTEFIAMVRTTPVVLEMHPDADPSPELDLPRKGD